MNPKHSNPTRNDRKAQAPYNFVRLPEQIVAVDYRIPRHDCYTEHTGYIECSLKTLTPTYTRAAHDPQFFAKFAATANLMKDPQYREEFAKFFHLDDMSRPVIPGSSLRGMVRSLLEIAGYGKIRWVTSRRLFFRTVDNTALGTYYRNRMQGKVETGFLRKGRGGYYIKKCEVARVGREKLGHAIYQGRGPNRTPVWQGTPAQHSRVWVRISQDNNVVNQLKYEPTPELKEDLREGRLVITGDVPRKRMEFVFLLPEPNAEEIPVPDALIERFHDDDQITQWQERAFPRDLPQQECRERHGWLRKDRFLSSEGDPVFFLREDNVLVFFGRAQMFRLPYPNSPLDLVPEHLRNEESGLDLVDAIFGYVIEGERTDSRAGRVYFTDAVCVPNQGDVWLSDGSLTPKILASPKPTAFQYYLVQDKSKEHDPDRNDTLAHSATERRDNSMETVIRGHKLYWHKGVQVRDLTDQVDDWMTDTQHTVVRPVKEGVEFRFRVYFENLTEVELGAVLWVLDLPKGHHHKLGMGKPLGLGSVEINPRLVLSDRVSRYQRLLDGDDWHRAEQVKEDTSAFKRSFEEYVLERMDQTERQGAKELKELPRIKELLEMLKYPGRGANQDYMTFDRSRRVLPGPFGVRPGR